MAEETQATEAQTCAECGRAVPADAQTLGLCPRCLINSAVVGGDDAGSMPRHFTAPPPAALSAELPELEVLELIGQGGMGAVYKARQVGLDRLVAVKVFPLDDEASDAPPSDGSGGSAAGNFAQRFLHEARLLARLSHPNIVAAHHAGQSARHCYLVMEYVAGPTLRDVLQGGPLPQQQALRVAGEVCDALAYAHGQGVVHRDVKPENILLEGGFAGRVRVADFGLARLLDQRSAWMGLTVEGHRLGTPYYMAPEQGKGGAAVDARADVYSLGVLLYEMLTGELPVGRFPPPSQKLATAGTTSVDPRLDRVVLRCLEPDPRLRYASAAEVKAELFGVGTAQPLPAPPRPVPTAFVGPAELAYQPTIPDSIHPAYRRRLVMNAAAIGAVAAVVVIAAGAVAAVLAWRARGRGAAQVVATATQPATRPAAPTTAPQPPQFPRLTGQPWPPGFGPRVGPPPFPGGFAGPEEWLQRMTQEHGADRVATVQVDGLPGDVTSHIRERLQALARPAGMFSSGSADSLTVRMAPISDLQALADKIDFGKVEKVDAERHLIRVRADATKLPRPLPPAVTSATDPSFIDSNVRDASSWDATRRREAVARLRDAPAAADRPEVAAVLRQRLAEDTDAQTRVAAAAAMATWVAPENTNALTDALKDQDRLVRRQVLETLGKLKDGKAAPAVAALLPDDRLAAAACLKSIGPAAEDAVIPYLNHSDHWARVEAAKVLAEIGTSRSLPALRELSESKDGLATVNAKQAIQSITQRSGDGDVQR